MNCNPVLNFIIEVKNKYIDYYGKEHLWDIEDGFQTVIQTWVWKIGNMGDKKRFDYQYILDNVHIAEYNRMAIFKYNSLFVDFDYKDGFFRECRGIVIDLENEKIVILPYRKFFNINEKEETNIKIIQEKINSANVIEFSDKLDGSLINAAYYNGNIVASSSGNIDKNKCEQLAVAYKYINNSPNISKAISAMPGYTFNFELIDSIDPHVITYTEDECGLYLTGIRNIDTQEQLNYCDVIDIAHKYNLKTVKIFNDSFEDIIKSIHNVNENREGYVINIDGYRVKLKYDEFLSLQHIKNSLTVPNAVLEAIRCGYFDDIYSKVPSQYQSRLLEIGFKVSRYTGYIDKQVKHWLSYCLEHCENANDRKTFMIYVSDYVPYRYQKYVRNLYNGKDNDYLFGIRWKDIQEWFGETE